MSLLYAVMLLGASAVLIRTLFIVSRLPSRPWWARESISHPAIVAVTGFIACGFIFLLEFLFTLNDKGFELNAFLATIGIVAVGASAWKLMDRWSPSPPRLSVVPPPIRAGNGHSTVPPEQPSKAA